MNGSCNSHWLWVSLTIGMVLPGLSGCVAATSPSMITEKQNIPVASRAATLPSVANHPVASWDRAVAPSGASAVRPVAYEAAQRDVAPLPRRLPTASQWSSAGQADASEEVALASGHQPDPEAEPHPAAASPPAHAIVEGGPDDPFVGEAELGLEPLVMAVRSRNPSIDAMSEAWRAAAERYPQVISLEDPMFGFMKGLPDGWMVEMSQKLPWPGKRALRGNVASAEADAACQEVEDTRLRLTEAATMAFFDYYQAERQLEVSVENLKLLQDFRKIALTKYESGQATQQDVLQADVEIADLGTRTAEFERMRDVSAARINALLHRAIDAPLPPPPARVAAPAAAPDFASLQELAIHRRPDLAAIAARTRAEEASLCLAYKAYYPDVELVAKHDTFMSESSMFPQVGLNVNVPLQRESRHAGVREMSAKVRQRRAEYRNQLDQASFEVQSAAKRLAEGQRVVELYEKQILPAGRRNVESARIHYTANRLDFLRLVDAQRQFRMQQEKYFQSIAESRRRLAELERAVGGPLP